MIIGDYTSQYRLYLVGGFKHVLYIFSISYMGCHHPNWLSYFSEGLNHQPDIISNPIPILQKLNTRGQFKRVPSKIIIFDI